MKKDAFLQRVESQIKVCLTKVYRNKVYRWTEEIYTDNDNLPCKWATLVHDGEIFVNTGGTAMSYFDQTRKIRLLS